VRWFHESVLPRVRDCLPWVRLIVTGADPPPPVRALRGPNLELVGHVDDLGTLYDRVRAAVFPLRYGCGVASRTREAIAHGVPVVATRRAVAGLKVTEKEVVSVSDDPQVMAQALVDLLRDRQVWEERRFRLARLHERRPPSAGTSWADVLAEARQLRVAALGVGG
jgi:glycosyltransferase involved in cell wall biosynthesis